MDIVIKKFGIVTEIDHVLIGGIVDMFIFSKGSAR